MIMSHTHTQTILVLRVLLHFLYILLRVTSGNETKHIKYVVYDYEDLLPAGHNYGWRRVTVSVILLLKESDLQKHKKI